MRKIKLVLLVSAATLLMMGCGAKTSTETAATSTVETETSEAEVTEESTEKETTEKETTEEETTEEETTSKAAKSKSVSGPLSDDLYSFQISIDGDVHQFPMKYSEFAAYGWEYDGDEKTTLDAMYKAGSQVFKKGKLQCYATIANFDINALPLNECYITGIKIDVNQNKSGAEIIMPGNIQLGVAAREDIKAAYGNPTEENNMDNGSSYYRYNKDVYEGVTFSFFKDEKTLYGLELNNVVMPEDLEVGEVSADVPGIVGKYQTPGEMSDDLARFTVTYGESIYRLPAPVSEFEKNGWKVLEDKSETQVAGRNFGWVTMMKDNQELKVMANNYSEEATSIHNCFVTSVVSDDNGTKIPLTISGGITMGMSQEELLKALSGVDYEEEDNTELYVSYKVAPGSSSLDSYKIFVLKSDQKVFKIKVENTPKFNQMEEWLSK